MYFLFTRIVERHHKTRHFIPLLNVCSVYQHSLLLAYWWVGKDWKEELWVVLSFSFLQHKFLANRKDKERTSWLFFLGHQCLLSAFEASAGLNSKYSTSYLLSCRCYRLNLCLLWVSMNSHVSQAHWDSILVGCRRLSVNGMARNSRGHTHCTYLLS